MGFELGAHGQGYEISGVSIDLAAAPADLTVSLWAGPPPGFGRAAAAHTKLFEFANPNSFAVGLNEFTAPGRRVRVPGRRLLRRAVRLRGLFVDQRDDLRQ
ncbi:hypothetical protein [Candidatus Poriferisodalis sp.]|uniref:hypothetical protein n=1 Tax=Candidatus Poriferisodalis sp. TaxID=3101277 RepID=UPI003B59858B